MEKRSYNFEVEYREGEDGKSPVMIGHAAVFDEYADMGGFLERVVRGAFLNSIQIDDVRALFNHDANYVLGRNKAGTLRMEEDERGLKVEIHPPDTVWARDLMTSMKRGDISQMSFAFTVDGAEGQVWIDGENGGMDKRDLIKLKLWDVSPVTYPAYEGTDIALSMRKKQLAERPPVSGGHLDIYRRKLENLKRRK